MYFSYLLLLLNSTYCLQFRLRPKIEGDKLLEISSDNVVKAVAGKNVKFEGKKNAIFDMDTEAFTLKLGSTYLCPQEAGSPLVSCADRKRAKWTIETKDGYVKFITPGNLCLSAVQERTNKSKPEIKVITATCRDNSQDQLFTKEDRNSNDDDGDNKDMPESPLEDWPEFMAQDKIKQSGPLALKL